MSGFSNDLISLRNDVVNLKEKIEEALSIELPTYKKILDECVLELDDALNRTRLPEYYRVAIVGRFKVGKSSFVNKLANERLAGVETSPETAAISIFRYAESTYADVELINKEEWEKMREIYTQDKNDLSIRRYSSFITFNNRFSRKDNDGKQQKLPTTDLSKQEAKRLNSGDSNRISRKNSGGKRQDIAAPIDLTELEAKWLKPGGHVHRINATDWNNKDGKKKFLKEIKEFTSSQSPLHYMVNRLVIYAPIPLLADHIELVDTPGLDDTERFRVRLTEEVVKEVDAILFLTTSGGSYSQSDKDFIIRQLRQRQIKHLQIIVTKTDDTYQAKERQSKEDDEEPPTFESFKKEEERRIRSEIESTLNELLDSNQIKDEDGYYFIEQLDNIPIHFVSTHYFDEGDHEKSGIPSVREKLYEILSNSYRFEQSKKILIDCSNHIVERLKLSFSSRLDALESDYNADKVQSEIERIREALEEQLTFFKKEISTPIQALTDEQQALGKHLSVHIDSICLLAGSVLNDLEITDIAKHWRTKRAGNWGYLNDLQTKIADKIFPRVEILLNHYIDQLDNFSSAINEQVKHLQKEVQNIEENNKLSGLDSLSLLSCQERVLVNLKKLTQQYTESQRDSIVKQLDDFVTDEVQSKISAAKDKVSDVLGGGTTRIQNSEVTGFYQAVRRLLSNALRHYLEAQLNNFADGLLSQAKAVQPQISKELMSQLDIRIEAIQSKLTIATSEEKNRVALYLNEMLRYSNQSLSQINSN